MPKMHKEVQTNGNPKPRAVVGAAAGK
jgi:hypothetical protein